MLQSSLTFLDQAEKSSLIYSVLPNREEKPHNVLRQESEGEVTQERIECFDPSGRFILGLS